MRPGWRISDFALQLAVCRLLPHHQKKSEAEYEEWVHPNPNLRLNREKATEMISI